MVAQAFTAKEAMSAQAVYARPTELACVRAVQRDSKT